MKTLSPFSRKLHGCWPVIVRTQRSRCVNWPSSLRCCSTPSSSASSSSTWTAWWTTPWRCTKTGRSWTCGASRRRRPSERSKQFPSLSKEQRHRCRNYPRPDWSFVLLVFVFLLSFWIISGSSNTPRTLAWLLPFWRERFWLWMLPSPPLLLSSSLQHLVSNGISLLFQTVAECVLFYYLTKKNENYKNIVRRNYRRRGRSQVFFQLLNNVC